MVPTIVLAEFYAQVAKRAGRVEAMRRFDEIRSYDFDFPLLDVATSQEAGHLRQRYKEKIPWSDCIIAASAIINNADYVVSEDSHFQMLDEIKARRMNQITL